MIIGITGTNGSGKGAVVEYLVAQKGFSHYSARAFIINEIHFRHLPVNRSTMRETANALRKEHGPSYLVESMLKLAAEDTNAVMESIRTIGEAQFLKSQGAFILAVDADKQLRYDRVVARGTETDKISFEEFVKQEDCEMESVEPWDMNVFGVMKLADAKIMNGGSLEELKAQVDQALETFSQKKV